MQKIIFINRFYFPDSSATSQLLTDLSENLAGDGELVHVIASRQRYQDAKAGLAPFELINKVYVHRIFSTRFGRSSLLGRAIDYLSFYISALFFLVFFVKKNDVVVAKTDPPLISVIAAFAVTLKRAVLINWIQDLFPEVAAKLNVKGLSFKPIYYLIKWIRDWSLRKAHTNVVIGDLMAETVVEVTSRPEKTIVISNWAVGDNVRPVKKSDNYLIDEWELGGKFIIGYSGNFGRAHEWEKILTCIIAAKKNKNLIFLFIGGGEGYLTLQEEVAKQGLTNAIFKPYQPFDRLAYSLSLSDVHLVSLNPSMEGLIVPSKIYGILAVGRPIIFIGSESGEVARIIEENQCGWVISNKAQNALYPLVISLYEGSKEMPNQEKLSRLYTNKYSSIQSLGKWKNILDAVNTTNISE